MANEQQLKIEIDAVVRAVDASRPFPSLTALGRNIGLIEQALDARFIAEGT